MIIAIISWWLTGVFSTIFWWIRESDFTTSDIPAIAIVGILGPIMWIIGYFIHGKKRIIIKRRVK